VANVLKAEAGITERFRNTPFVEALTNFEQYSAEEATSGLSPETIGQAVWLAFSNARPKVCRTIVPQRFKNWTIPKLIPMRILDKLVAQFFGIKKRKNNASISRQ
jgi:hypothetical protein